MGPGYPSSPHSLPGRDHSHHPLAWGALSLSSAPTSQARAPPQPAWPSLPTTCPGVSWMLCPPPLAHPPPATTHVCPRSPLCPRYPGPVARPHLGHGGLSHSLSPGSHCPQAHIVPQGFWQCPPGAHKGVCLGQWAEQAAGSPQAAPHTRAPSGTCSLPSCKNHDPARLPSSPPPSAAFPSASFIFSGSQSACHVTTCHLAWL